MKGCHCNKTTRVYTPRAERYHVRTINKQAKNEINLLRTLEWYKVNYNEFKVEKTTRNETTWNGTVWTGYKDWA